MSIKRRTIKSVVSLLMVLMMVIAMVAMAVVPAGASEDDVRAAANGVLHMTAYLDGQAMWTGSCFLINNDTIITANHCVHLSEEWYKEYYKSYGANSAEFNKLLTYTVTIARDFTIPMTVINSSENMDFAIMRLSQPINNRKALALRNSENVKAAERAYAIGFPGAKDSGTATYQYYNEKDIAFESGTVNRTQYTENIITDAPYFELHCDVIALTGNTYSSGSSGGPVVDADGNVIGVCSTKDPNETTCYATAISQVREVLDAIGIKYIDADGVVPPTIPPVTEKPTDPNNPGTTEPPVITPPANSGDTSTEVTNTDTTTEKSSDSSKTIIIVAIIALVVILIVVIIVIIVVNGKKKNNNNNNGPKGGTPNMPMPPTMPQQPQRPMTPPYAQPYSRPQMPQGMAPTVPSNEGAGETSVLNEGVGETTVLGQQATGFALIRKSSGERIGINKPEFVIGKERRRVDYCIADNSSVSRTHAKVRVRSGVCYISDLGSTNCTYVNGSKLAPNQEVALRNGDKIKIADEEFDFIG